MKKTLLILLTLVFALSGQLATADISHTQIVHTFADINFDDNTINPSDYDDFNDHTIGGYGLSASDGVLKISTKAEEVTYGGATYIVGTNRGWQIVFPGESLLGQCTNMYVTLEYDIKFAGFPFINRLFFVPLALQLLCDSLTAVFLSFEKFYYNFKRVVAINLINAILPPAVSILLLISFDIGYFARIYSLLFVSVIVSLYSIWKIVKKRGSGKIFIKEAFLYSLPMLPHAISTAVSVQADKLIIGSILGEGALGKYSVIFSMGNSLQFIVTAIGSALTPWIIRRIESGEKEKVSSLIFPMTLGYCALGSCLIAISPEALAILAPGEYFDAYPALLPIALTIPFYFIYTVSTACIVYQGRAKYLLTVSAVCSVLSIILNYTLVTALGYIGAGISLLICQVISSVMSLVFLSKTNANGIIDPWRVIIAASIYIPLGMLIFSFKSSIVARSILLIIPAAILLYCLIKAKKLVIENPAK